MIFLDPIQFPDGTDANATNVLVRYPSAGGLWHLDVCRVLFGLRLNLGPAVDPDHGLRFCRGYEVSYCMGVQKLTLMLLPRLVMKILEPVPEICNLRSRAPELEVVRELFPRQTIKPMHLDQECWRALLDLADGPETPAEALELAGEIELYPSGEQLLAGARS